MRGVLVWLFLLCSVIGALGRCTVGIPGIKGPKLMLTDPGREGLPVSIEVGQGEECLLTIVAIGGGGGDNMGSMAGGGSGNVEWTQRRVTETITVQATVGNGTAYNWWAPCCGCGARAGASAVIWWEGSEVFLIAQPGGDGTGGVNDGKDHVGGDGYSGGGGEYLFLICESSL